MKTLSTAQLADYLNVTKRTIQRRGIKESWQYEVDVGLGGERRLYIFESLPIALKHQIVACIVAKHEQYGLQFQPSGINNTLDSIFDMYDSPFITLQQYDQQSWVSYHVFAHNLDIAELNKQYIKQGLVVMAKLYHVIYKMGKIKAYDQFCQLYNDRALTINDNIYSVMGHISRISLLRWEKPLLEN